MPLEIHLDNPQPIYSGNETIRGRVVFQCPNAIEIQDIRVTLSGRAKAKIQKVKGSAALKASYRSKCVLIEKERILMALNGATITPETYEWPFEFVLPSHAQDAAKWPEKQPFRSDANHPLPPTFATEIQDSLRKLDCAVDYKVRAQVFKPQKVFLGKRSAVYDEAVRLEFLPLAAQSDSAEGEPLYRQKREQLFTIRSLLLLPENRGRSLGLTERFQSWLSPGQLPRFDFQASLTYSSQIVRSTPLVCLLNISPFMENASVSSPPEILLQAVSIAVVSRTAARTSPSLMGAMSGEVDERIEILSKTSVGMPVSGQVDLNQAFGPLVFKHSDVSFGTFNISRLYRLQASFVFDCAGKTLEFNLPDLAVNIVAKTPDFKEEVRISDQGRQELGTTEKEEPASTAEKQEPAPAAEVNDGPPSYASVCPTPVRTSERSPR